MYAAIGILQDILDKVMAVGLSRSEVAVMRPLYDQGVGDLNSLLEQHKTGTGSYKGK